MSDKLIDWILSQTPTVAVTIGFLGVILYLYRLDKKQAIADAKEKDDKLDEAIKQKDEGLNRFYNALTEWSPIIHETTKAMEANTTELRKGGEGFKDKLILILAELNSIKSELDHLKDSLK